MKVTVKHMIRNEETGNVEGFTPVAEVSFPDGHNVHDVMEYAFRWTNNVMGSWSIKEKQLELRNGDMIENGDYNEDVTVLHNRPDGMGQRSTMVGDLMEIDGVTWRVGLAGFELHTLKEVA